MKDSLILAKIVVVNGKETLGPEFDNFYHPEVGMYLIFSEASFNLKTYSHEGKLKLHDRIIRETNIPDLPDDKINFITIDNKLADKTHTYLSVNRRHYQLTNEQLEFIMTMFQVDYCNATFN